MQRHRHTSPVSIEVTDEERALMEREARARGLSFGSVARLSIREYLLSRGHRFERAVSVRRRNWPG